MIPVLPFQQVMTMKVLSDSASSRRRVLFMFCVFNFLGGEAACIMLCGGFAAGFSIAEIERTRPEGLSQKPKEL